MDTPLLIPVPKHYESLEGTYSVEPNLKDQIFIFTLSDPLPGRITAVGTTDLASEQEYRLHISKEAIEIRHKSEAGLYYAMQTLKQLSRQGISTPGGGIEIPCCLIEDRPDFDIRGIHYDISRDRVPTMETLCLLIDLWSELKFNQLQLYMEHTFAYSGHHRVWRHASPMTAEEVRVIDRYCRERGIELVPNQNSFGHMERWLQYPEYFHLAEAPDGFTDHAGVFYPRSSTISPAVPESIDFLGGLYDELLPNFESRSLNIGGDEPYELGQGRSKELCEKHGKDRVYADFIRKIHDLAAKRGRKTQVYADIIMHYPHLAKELPDDITLMEWGYEWDHPFEKECAVIADAGMPFYIIAGTSTWNTIGGRRSNAYKNIQNAAVQGKAFGAEGFYISEWGDNGHFQQLPVALPCYYMASASAWNLESAGNTDIAGNLSLHVLNETQPDASRALLLLGDVWENDIAHLHNASIQAAAILDPVFPYHRKDFLKYRGYTFEKELSILDEADTLLGHTGPAVDKRLIDELAFTSTLLRHGCSLARNRFAAPGLLTAEITQPVRRELANQLTELIPEYRRLWLDRSRPGGLSDSAGRLEKLKDTYI